MYLCVNVSIFVVFLVKEYANLKTLENIFKCSNMSAPTKITTGQAIMFPVTLYDSENWKEY